MSDGGVIWENSPLHRYLREIGADDTVRVVRRRGEGSEHTTASQWAAAAIKYTFSATREAGLAVYKLLRDQILLSTPPLPPRDTDAVCRAARPAVAVALESALLLEEDVAVVESLDEVALFAAIAHNNSRNNTVAVAAASYTSSSSSAAVASTLPSADLGMDTTTAMVQGHQKQMRSHNNLSWFASGLLGGAFFGFCCCDGGLFLTAANAGTERLFYNKAIAVATAAKSRVSIITAGVLLQQLQVVKRAIGLLQPQLLLLRRHPIQFLYNAAASVTRTATTTTSAAVSTVFALGIGTIIFATSYRARQQHAQYQRRRRACIDAVRMFVEKQERYVEAVARAVRLIQEVELTARGYGLTAERQAPITRLELAVAGNGDMVTQHRACMPLRSCLAHTLYVHLTRFRAGTRRLLQDYPLAPGVDYPGSYICFSRLTDLGVCVSDDAAVLHRDTDDLSLAYIKHLFTICNQQRSEYMRRTLLVFCPACLPQPLPVGAGGTSSDGTSNSKGKDVLAQEGEDEDKASSTEQIHGSGGGTAREPSTISNSRNIESTSAAYRLFCDLDAVLCEGTRLTDWAVRLLDREISFRSAQEGVGSASVAGKEEEEREEKEDNSIHKKGALTPPIGHDEGPHASSIQRSTAMQRRHASPSPLSFSGAADLAYEDLCGLSGQVEAHSRSAIAHLRLCHDRLRTAMTAAALAGTSISEKEHQHKSQVSVCLSKSDVVDLEAHVASTEAQLMYAQETAKECAEALERILVQLGQSAGHGDADSGSGSNYRDEDAALLHGSDGDGSLAEPVIIDEAVSAATGPRSFEAFTGLHSSDSENEQLENLSPEQQKELRAKKRERRHQRREQRRQEETARKRARQKADNLMLELKAVIRCQKSEEEDAKKSRHGTKRGAGGAAVSAAVSAATPAAEQNGTG